MSKGFVFKLRRPAEFEPHYATWFCWPHASKDWPGRLKAVRRDFLKMVYHLAEVEVVRLIVQNAEQEKNIRKLLNECGVNINNVEFLAIKTDRSWLRDNGPLFMHLEDRGEVDITADYLTKLSDEQKEEKLCSTSDWICRFSFNGWARFSGWELDSEVPNIVSEKLKIPLIDAVFPDGQRMVLEGGSIDVNGRGSLITTRSCLLSDGRYARNPGRDQSEIELVLEKYLGAKNIIWLNKGLKNDETNGHIDNICRFINKDTLALTITKDQSDENYQLLEENRELLENIKLEDGQKVKIVFLPLPQPVFFKGRSLTASYANFYIANGKVIAPVFNVPEDKTALGILQECFPKRKVVGINGLNFIIGGGGIHCLAQEEC
ncbi:agmatine/peptidylarginine deiminase [Candidatus Margulisiibacteriota bacterium]